MKMFEDENVTFSLLNAFDLDFSGSPYVMQIKDEMAEESRSGLKKDMEMLQYHYPQAKIDVMSRFGALIPIVEDELNENFYDLVVIGCVGETALENFLLGSHAYEIVKKINTTILIVPKHARFRRPDKIVMATDLKDIMHDEVVDPLRNILHHFHASLLFVNVLNSESENRLQSEELLMQHFPGIDVDFNFVENNDVCNGILNFMDDNHADIVTMIRRKVGVIERLMHPSITKKMVLQPEHPMLIIHDE
jgi:nucleotide-binding universal stress UspA family protein